MSFPISIILNSTQSDLAKLKIIQYYNIPTDKVDVTKQQLYTDVGLYPLHYMKLNETI